MASFKQWWDIRCGGLLTKVLLSFEKGAFKNYVYHIKPENRIKEKVTVKGNTVFISSVIFPLVYIQNLLL